MKREVVAEARNPLFMGMAHTALAYLALQQGELAEAEAQGRRACELLRPTPPFVLHAHMALVDALLAQGRAAEAHELATQGVQELERIGSRGAGSVGTYLALAEACLALGDSPAADEALHQALQCLRERASDISEPAARERFLTRVPENARTLELARQRWGEGL